MEKTAPNIKILVACHKADPAIRRDDIYMPIQVGKALHPELDLGFQTDDTGENISDKNGSYCELTAVYWAWKNLKNVDYIGLAHYRRYFDFKTFGASTRIVAPEEVKTLKDLTPDIKKLNEDEVIVPSFWSCATSIETNFQKNVLSQDIYILYKVIEKYSPDYLPTFEKYMLGNHRTGYNMFIMSWKNFDNYCSWLFSILFKVEKSVRLTSYISYIRLFGYFGELLLPIFCIHNGLKIKQVRIALADGSPRKKYTYGRKQIRDKIFDLSFALSRIPPKRTIKNPYWELYLNLDKIDI